MTKIIRYFLLGAVSISMLGFVVDVSAGSCGKKAASCKKDSYCCSGKCAQPDSSVPGVCK